MRVPISVHEKTVFEVGKSITQLVAMHRPLKSSPECFLMEFCLPTLKLPSQVLEKSNQASSL